MQHPRNGTKSARNAFSQSPAQRSLIDSKLCSLLASFSFIRITSPWSINGKHFFPSLFSFSLLPEHDEDDNHKISVFYNLSTKGTCLMTPHSVHSLNRLVCGSCHTWLWLGQINTAEMFEGIFSRLLTAMQCCAKNTFDILKLPYWLKVVQLDNLEQCMWKTEIHWCHV